MVDINGILNKMRSAGKLQEFKEKGDLGEEAVLQLCYERKQKMGNGLLYQSFMYPYQSTRNGIVHLGNIKYENGKFVEYTDSNINDEIDILYATPYRVFAIEVKSYHSRMLDIYDHWFNNQSTPVDKSPIFQAEKHARHLYHAIYDVLPDGNPDYIVPMVCFVDNCKVRDDRSDEFRMYVPVCVLNNFIKTLELNNVPLEWNIDLKMLETKLNSIKVSIKRVM